jgi:site-specific DNA-cytosine methylase
MLKCPHCGVLNKFTGSRSDGKTYCLDTMNTNAVEIKSMIRRLTPTECERLQTVNDGYTAHVSDSQRYKMLGNGWNVDTIVHILNYIK